MRLRDRLLTGAGVGLAAGLCVGVALDGGLGVPVYACAGGLLGLLCGAYLESCERAPFWTAMALLCAAPLSLPLGALLGLSALGELPLLLALPLAALLVRRREARDLLAANMLTFAVGVYTAVAILAALIHPAQSALPLVLETLAPLVAFVVGMTLHVCPSADERSEDSLASLAAGASPQTRLLPLLGWILAGATLLVALSVDVTARLPAGSALARRMVADRGALANLLALLVIGALCWDSSRTYVAALLGQPARWRRMALGLAGAATLVATVAAFATLGSRSALVGLGLTLAAVAALRRGLTPLALLVAATLPLLALFGDGALWLNPRLSALGPALSPGAWRHALDAAARGPFGARLPEAPQTLYLTTLGGMGLLGLLGLLAALGVTLVWTRRAYRTLRANDTEMGGALAAGACALFLLLGGLTSDPLATAPVAFLFWLLLGRANATFARVAQAEAAGDLARLGRRGAPLRVLYTAAGDAGETAAALLDAFHGLDRAQVTPLLVAYGEGQLARAAPDADVLTQVVPRHDPAAMDLAATLAASRHAALRRLGATRMGDWLCDRSDALGNLLAHAHEWRQLARATLDLRPDVVVSASPATHLPALLAGWLAGASVLWRAYDVATPRAQRAQDALLGWTAGVLAPSQTVARAYQPWLGSLFSGRVRVLRPGIVMPEPLAEAQRDEVRRALGVPNAHPLLAVVAPLSPGGGHRILLDALTTLRAHYPDLHVVIASEGVAPSAGESREPTLEEQVGARWLSEAVAAAGLDGHVTQLGARADAARLLAAVDVAVFPAQQAPMSRPLLLALAQGTPIVAANAGALAEHLAEAWGHELCEPGDAWSLAHAVETVVERLPRYRLDARRNPGLIRDWGTARLEQARLLSICRELCAPATRLRAPWPRKKAANLPERWLAALWAGVGRWEEPDVLATEPEPEREDLAAVAASVAVAPAGDQAWASIGA